MSDDGQCEIVLDHVEPGRQPAAALYLSGCFSLPPASTRRIAAAAPLAILSGLSEAQAAGVLKDMSASLPEGVGLRISKNGGDEDIGRLEWPAPPKIYGRDIAEYGRTPERGVIPCPACGRLLKVAYDPGGGVKVGLAGSSGKTVMIPNPASSAGDKDPLFSGFRPLAEGMEGLASLRALQAGDSSFWMEARQNFFPQTDQEPVRGRRDAADPEAEAAGERDAAGPAPPHGGGLTEFMKLGLYAVVVARTRDAHTVKMLAETMGLSESDAGALAASRSLCVARNIALDEAQTLLARFRSLGANARIVKPM